MHIRINAEVECTDGPCGRLVSVIVDPKDDEVTHIVVRDRGFPNAQRLVPLKRVKANDGDPVHIDRSSAELASLERFMEIVYVDQADPSVMDKALEDSTDAHIRWEEARPGQEMLLLGAVDVPVEHELVPDGEVVLHRGSRVIAIHGRMAKVEGFLIDPQTGKLTHLIMKGGHLWSRHELLLPAAQIERVEDDKVFLRRHQQTAKGHVDIPN